MLVTTTAAGVEVRIDPIIQGERQKAIFDEDLTKEGVVPILILVSNNGQRVIVARKSEMALVWPDGARMNPLPASAAAGKASRIAGVVGWTIAFGLIGGAIAAQQERNAGTIR